MRNNRNYENRLRIIVAAHNEGYNLYRVNEWSYVFKRTTEQTGRVTINVYWNRKDLLFTVSTALDHPKQGKTQMTRKFLGVRQVTDLLINPRKHTGRGYKKKKR